MLKKRSEQFWWFFACALWLTPHTFTQDDFDFDLDDMSIAVSVDVEEERRIHDIDASLTKACPEPQLSPAEVVEILTSTEPPLGLPALQIQNLLQKYSLYKFTNPPIVRELHDLPTLMPFQYHCAPSWAFSANGFYNQTSKMLFTRNSPYIGSYVDFSSPGDILDELELREFVNADIPDVLDLFGQCMTLQERRIGAMLDVWKQYKRWLFTLSLPVAYIEHNFWLPEQKQEEIRNKPFFRGGAGLPGINFNTFTRQHLVRDRAGIGDLRLQVLYNLASQEKMEHQNQQMQIGGQITFPTAKTVISGLYGGPSCRTPAPLLDYYTLFNLYACYQFTDPQDKQSKLQLAELLTGYGIATLDQLAETVCDLRLGQQHFNLGPVVHLQQPIWCRNKFSSTFEFYGEMKYSIPANETRFLRIITPPEAFDRDYTSADLAESNLLFLNQQTSNLFFPAMVTIKTKPGLMFHTNASFNAFWHDWELGLGYDFWAQLQEKFGSVKGICTGFDVTQLNYCAGRKFSAYEGKIFGQAGMRLCGETFAMRFLVRGDATIFHKGIGNSFTLGLNFIIDY